MSTATTGINLSICLRWSWRHGDDWGIYFIRMTHHEYIVVDGIHEVVFGLYTFGEGWMLPGTQSHVLHDRWSILCTVIVSLCIWTWCHLIKILMHSKFISTARLTHNYHYKYFLSLTVQCPSIFVMKFIEENNNDDLILPWWFNLRNDDSIFCCPVVDINILFFTSYHWR